ncbi:MAG: efflux RND transporter periplasmic adaptor subunit [Polyangiaceae bacterium]|nr:efflux RND transporter periplasmic adaptor subunit [Polyangiaceae bacterium]
MSRVIPVELSVRNVLLFVFGMAAFGTAVAVGARALSQPGADASHADHGEGEHKEHGEGEHKEHGEGEHKEHGEGEHKEHGEGEHKEHGEGEHKEGEGEHKEHGEHKEGGEGEHKEGQIKLSPAALKNANLEIVTAGPSEVSVTISLPGEVSLNQDTLAHVTPRVAGVTREVKKKVGDVVKKGDLLAVLDSRDLAEAQREFLATKERLALSEGTFARAELLIKENVSAQKDFLSAKQAFAEAQIDHRSAAQKLQAVGGATAMGSGYALVAPIAGTIIDKHITVGEVLGDTTRAFTIADLSSIWVNVTVYAKDLPRVAAGQNASVRAEGIAESATGTIAYLGQIVGEQTRSATARIVLTNPGAAWRPGLFATADIAVDKVQAPVVIEDDAVQTVEGKQVIFVQEGESFEARPVTLGRTGYAASTEGKRLLEVLKGVKAGDRYVSKNSFLLKAELGKSEAGHEH